LVFGAFAAGLLSFLSPCVLPLVPGYITYLTGSSLADLKEGHRRGTAVYKALAFTFGFSIIFVLMGATITVLGQWFAEHFYLFKKVSGVLIILFGIHMTGLIKIKRLYSEKRFLQFSGKTKVAGAVFVGMAFAAGWTPCVGPILSSILIFAGSMDTVNKGVFLLVCYSLGLGVPFIVTALALERITRLFKKISIFLPVISVVSGLLLIALGVLVYTDNMTALIPYFDFIPVLS
jgi:cytochrome c-type biogenesis protein